MEEAVLLDGLDGAQREAVLTDAAPLVILAPAGSGKTRVVSHRIARRALDQSADANHVLAITFTRRAAGELQRRLARLGLRGRPTAGTFHGVAWAVLTQRWTDQRRTRPDLLADKRRVLDTVLDELAPRRSPAVRLDLVAGELEWARARLVSPSDYAERARRTGRRAPLPPDVLADVFAAYADRKRKLRLVDFDDLLELCADELLREPEFAAAQRWRFRHLFVDEFQDVNPLQFRLLEAWRGGRADLCVVGDPNQAIYGWNGADPSLLQRLPSLVGGATVVRLEHSYRSTPQLLTTAAALLPSGEGPTAVRPDGPPPQIHGYATEHDEARAIAALLAGRRPGRRWSSCAVLVRTRAQLAPIERALRQARIPVRVGQDRPLLDLPSVQAALRQGDAAERLADFVADLDTRLAELATQPDGEPEPAGLRQLGALGRELLSTTPSATVGGFHAWLMAGGAEVLDGADAVDVLTFHAAKGLEWPLVVVAGVEAGLVPHASAAGPEGRAEEVRLLYVALTRAEQELHCTWARARGRDVRRERKPSPLLALIQAAAAPPPVGPPPAEWSAGRPVAAASTTAAPSAMVAALRRWRAQAALAADLPEHAVCSDDVLQALAESRPETLDELAALLGPVAASRLGPRLLPVLTGPAG
jgi:DNA helicase-2/ATP-dependent DNA helicase PcrA